MIFKTITSLFLIVAIVCFLNLTPEQITNDLINLTKKEETVRETVRRLKTGKKKKSIKAKLLYIQSSLPACAFAGCNLLESVTIPDSVTIIGDGAFSGYITLTSITIY